MYSNKGQSKPSMGFGESVNVSEPKLNTDELLEDTEFQDDYRMWAASAFAIILLVIGLPLWWKTTEVFRVPLPYGKIAEFNELDIIVTVDVAIYTAYPSRTNKYISELEILCGEVYNFSIRFSPAKLDIEKVSIADLEQNENVHPKLSGQLLFIETTKMVAPRKEIILGKHRTLYFAQNTSSEKLYLALRSILQYNTILEILKRPSKSNALQVPIDLVKRQNRLRPDSQYDLIFTCVNPQPEKLLVSWDQWAVLNEYLKPLTNQLLSLATFSIKSQWLYFVDFGQQGTWDKQREYFVLSENQLPHIISPLEKKLGSSVSIHPCLHFVLYSVPCKAAPLHFHSAVSEAVDSLLSPRWGSVQLLNPFLNNCQNGTVLVPDKHKVMLAFVSHLRALLGVPIQVDIDSTHVLPLTSTLLRQWELDGLYRLQTLEQIVTAKATLLSLSELLGKISNIVINSAVGYAITEAVENIDTAVQLLGKGELEHALYHGRLAFTASETAFTHPSLLALLYFPDDQKYAVYIPLFLPIMIPVLMSVKNIRNWVVKIMSCRHH